MPKPVVYVETTIPSYLTSDPSRDLIVAANQQITHTWWRTAADRYDLVVSEFVLREIAAGDPAAASLRLSLVASLPVLRDNASVRDLVRRYRHDLGLTGRALRDVPHLAYAAAYNVDVIVTWNCTHLANGILTQRLAKVNGGLSLPTPSIVTPQSLLKEGESPFLGIEEE